MKEISKFMISDFDKRVLFSYYCILLFFFLYHGVLYIGNATFKHTLINFSFIVRLILIVIIGW